MLTGTQSEGRRYQRRLQARTMAVVVMSLVRKALSAESFILKEAMY